MYLEVITMLRYNNLDGIIRVTYMPVFHQYKDISASVYSLLPLHIYPSVLSCICVFLVTVTHV